MLNLSNHIFEFGPFRLDVRERLLLRDGEPVPLSPKTFNVLAVLVRQHGSLVEKDQLLSEVWPDTIVEESSLSQKVYQLRRILEESPGEDKYIQTVPRHGYRFIADVREITSPSVQSSRVSIADGENDDDVSGENSSARFIVEPGIVADESPETDLGSAPSMAASTNLHLAAPRSLKIIAACSVILFLVGAAIWVWRRQVSMTAQHPPRRIAVLPFKPLGDDSGNELLALGIADAVIGKLSRLNSPGQVTVLPTNSIYQFSGRDYDRIEAGRKLNVEAVLDGTVQRIGERVRVSAQLTRINDNGVLWVGQFDTNSNDIFSLQDSISLQLAESLTELTREQRDDLKKRETQSPASYEAYVTALYFWNNRTKEGVKKAVDYFQRAIEADPKYAKAYSGLADCYYLIQNYRYDIVSTEEAIQQQGINARKAFELDPNLSDAHLEMAHFFYLKGQYDQADREFQRALELDPSSSVAHMRYANALFGSLQLAQATDQMKLAQELNPASPILNAALGFMLLMERDLPGATRYCEKAIELDPKTPVVHVTLAVTYERSGKYDQAIAQYQQILESEQNTAMAGMAHVEAVSGNPEKAKQILAKLAPPSMPGDLYNRAAVQVALGDNAKAIEALNQASLNEYMVALLKYDPALDDLRRDGRFIEFLRARKLDQRLAQRIY